MLERSNTNKGEASVRSNLVEKKHLELLKLSDVH
jgi:hypothetical protein